MLSRSLNVGMTMDNPSAGSSDLKPGLPDAPTSRYNYPGSNYAFWEVNRPILAYSWIEAVIGRSQPSFDWRSTMSSTVRPGTFLSGLSSFTDIRTCSIRLDPL